MQGQIADAAVFVPTGATTQAVADGDPILWDPTPVIATGANPPTIVSNQIQVNATGAYVIDCHIAAKTDEGSGIHTFDLMKGVSAATATTAIMANATAGQKSEVAIQPHILGIEMSVADGEVFSVEHASNIIADATVYVAGTYCSVERAR